MNGYVLNVQKSRYEPQQPQVPTDFPLNTGPDVIGLTRQFHDNTQGVVGIDTQATIDWQQDQIFLPHRAIAVRRKGKASNAGLPSVDETAYVPAFAVGDPGRRW